MSEQAFEKIKAGLEEARAYAAHERGIEAALEIWGGFHSKEEIEYILSRYLEVSDLVLAPKGDPQMENAAWQVMKVFYKDKASKDVSDEILAQAIAAAPKSL